MKNLIYALLLLLPLVGCGTFAEFGEKYDAIESETTALLEGVDQSYEDGAIDATERDELIRSIVLESKARLDAAAREAGDRISPARAVSGATGGVSNTPQMSVSPRPGHDAAVLPCRRRCSGPPKGGITEDAEAPEWQPRYFLSYTPFD